MVAVAQVVVRAVAGWAADRRAAAALVKATAAAVATAALAGSRAAVVEAWAPQPARGEAGVAVE